MNSQNIIKDYENLLTNEEGANLSTSYFCYNNSNNHKLALELFRYAIETVLNWSPMEVVNCLDIKIIEKLNLYVPYKYLIFPEELNKRKDCFYVAHLLYPEIIPYNMREYVIISYKKVLSQETGKFSKSFFAGSEGELRACLCLQYLLKEYFTFSSIEEIYYYFSTAKAITSLRQYRLAGVCSELFESPLEFLHTALPNKQKNELYYQFYHFEAVLKEKKLKTKVKRIVGC
ncbi:hypothetical protein QA584_08195 [Anaerocolumna sp. AGMB13025]|jgi:hypothetical protein|uniref:hypothetical protein n=1 Tax=Anaerocolumna sp. AGMB13025 TaxID=3039116 RepID=UPI00241F62A9|nr:hypothetical protein [Anaerocolumna sp. AGMB13025]WFR59051.1 hypothetical protein QA584_08195 [Anaerocolumna sp. AGMB13025]